MIRTSVREKSQMSDTSSTEHEDLLSQPDYLARDRKHRRSPKSRFSRALFYLASFGSVGLVGTYIGAQWASNRSDARCTQQLSQGSPVFSDINIAYHVERFNGSLLKENMYRLRAGAEVDAAWDALGVNYRAMVIPEEQALKAGIQRDQVHVAPKYGGGYLANLEGLHQLHCLNLVRKSLYYNFEYYHDMHEGAFSNSDHILQLHVSHCLDIIRQQLMCTLDTGLLGQVWFNPDEPEPFVDFNTRHKCKNFHAIREWAKQRQAPLDVEFDYLAPPAEGDTIYGQIP